MLKGWTSAASRRLCRSRAMPLCIKPSALSERLMNSQSCDLNLFPILSESEMAMVAEIGDYREFAKGAELFSHGQRDYPFFVVVSGEIGIIDPTTGNPIPNTIHCPGGFTGDVDMLTGRPAIITAVANSDTVAYELCATRLRRLLNDIPEFSDKLLNAFQVRRRMLEASDFQGVQVLGETDSRETLQLREFFHKNRVLHTFHDIADESGAELLKQHNIVVENTPILIAGSKVVHQPSLAQVAECLGISRDIKDELYDVVIVGAGPAGLAAAVYAGSEGLRTLVIDRVGPGGQAGQSSKIENYMGFPSGLPGAELANRGYLQALKFGVEFTAPVSVKQMECTDDNEHRITLCTGQTARARTVLIATGASYRRLPVENCSEFERLGIYYSATSVETRVCRDATAMIVGGGNSAGQAAMFLSQHAKEVKILLRGNDLGKSMSHYLAHRIEQTANIEVCGHSEISQLIGNGRLSQIVMRNNQSGEETTHDCPAAFIFIGAKPHTEWLSDNFALDEHGFIKTGSMVENDPLWKLDRNPCELETTCPGVFAIGDVRSGTTKRCAFAVGDGALGVTCVHQYLSKLV